MTMNLAVPTNTPAIDKAETTNRRLLWVIAIAVVVVVVGVAAVLIFRFKDSAKQSTTQHGVDAITASIARQDCARVYSSDRGAVVEKAGAIERQSNIDFAGYLLSAPGISTDTLQKNQADLEAANKAVLALPLLSDMVDRGYTLNGVHHPPCPMVK